MQGVDDAEMLSAKAIAELHDRATAAWHQTAGGAEADFAPAQGDAWAGPGADPWLAAVARQHRANFELWHIEDEARTPAASDAQLASVKRRIDVTNQRRNDLAEELDRLLLEHLAARSLPRPQATLHSESPGLMIDRLSILALKIYHTGEEAARPDAPAGHAERNRQRLAILLEQRTDLAGCLDDLWRRTLGGQSRFKLYRQLKMYNDPALNPSIYGAGTASSSR